MEIKSFKYAYVIYDLLHRRHTDKVLDYLKGIGIHSNGRFAEFEYVNTDNGVVEKKYDDVDVDHIFYFNQNSIQNNTMNFFIENIFLCIHLRTLFGKKAPILFLVLFNKLSIIFSKSFEILKFLSI